MLIGADGGGRSHGYRVRAKRDSLPAGDARTSSTPAWSYTAADATTRSVHGCTILRRAMPRLKNSIHTHFLFFVHSTTVAGITRVSSHELPHTHSTLVPGLSSCSRIVVTPVFRRVWKYIHVLKNSG